MERAEKRIRISTALLFVLFVLSLGARVTGVFVHEVLGLAYCIGALFHALEHAGWFFNWRQGTWGLRRIISTAVNAALALGFTIVLITGVCLSPDVFSFLNLPSDMFVRQLHSQTAYWLLVVVGLHMGLHAEGCWRRLKAERGKAWAWALAVLTVTVGIVGFLDRMLFQKLFLGFSFDFWDPARPVLLYFVLYAASLLAVSLAVYAASTVLGRSRHDALFRRSH